MRINWLVLHCSACLQIVVCVILVERTLPFLYSKSNSCELSLSPIYQFSDRTKFKDPHVLWTHKPIRILRDVRCRGLMVTEALQFGWQVRDGFQRQRRSKEGYFGGRLQGPSLMKAANIWLLDWINEFFSIAQEAFFFGGGVFFFCWRQNCCWKKKNTVRTEAFLWTIPWKRFEGKQTSRNSTAISVQRVLLSFFFWGGFWILPKPWLKLWWNSWFVDLPTAPVSRWIGIKTHREEWTFWRRRLGSGKWTTQPRWPATWRSHPLACHSHWTTATAAGQGGFSETLRV